jgi:hypothetical protein
MMTKSAAPDKTIPVSYFGAIPNGVAMRFIGA